jgi:acyl-CoA thioester hydrolase
MARIQLDFPDAFVFETDIPVRVSDLNYGAHVGNDSILTLMQEARVQWYRSLGFASEVSFEGSVGQIIADAAIQYKSEAFLGDVITIQLAIADVSKYGFDILYRLINAKTSKEVARGKTGIVCFDYAARKVTSIPESLKRVLH